MSHQDKRDKEDRARNALGMYGKSIWYFRVLGGLSGLQRVHKREHQGTRNQLAVAGALGRTAGGAADG